MARVCNRFKFCKKVLIDDQGVIRNHPNKVIREDGGRIFLCDECLSREGVKKTEEQNDSPDVVEEIGREESKENARKVDKEIMEPEPKGEVSPAPKKEVKKTAKKKRKGTR